MLSVFTKVEANKPLTLDELVVRMNECLVRDREPGTCACPRERTCQTKVQGYDAVGSTNRLFSLLLPMVLSCRSAVLFVPPVPVHQIWSTYAHASEHFDVPSLIMPNGTTGKVFKGRPVLHLLPSSAMSRPEGRGGGGVVGNRT